MEIAMWIGVGLWVAAVWWLVWLSRRRKRLAEVLDGVWLDEATEFFEAMRESDGGEDSAFQALSGDDVDYVLRLAVRPVEALAERGVMRGVSFDFVVVPASVVGEWTDAGCDFDDPRVRVLRSLMLDNDSALELATHLRGIAARPARGIAS